MIAVLGATGQVGRHVVEGLADKPVEAVAVVRRRGPIDLPIPTRRGDLSDPASMRVALEGAERLLLVTPHGPDQDLHERTAIDAAAEVGVRHIVKISGGAASLGPNGTTATAVAHWLGERRIERTGIGFTFLRPSFFQQNLLSAIAPIVARTGLLIAPFGHTPVAMVDVRDVAACAVAVLIDPCPLDRAWQLTGPRPVSFDDIAAYVGVRYIAIPPRTAGRGLARQGVPAAEVAHAVRMASYFAAGADTNATGDVLHLSDRRPRPVEDLLDEHRPLFEPGTALARLFTHSPTYKD